MVFAWIGGQILSSGLIATHVSSSSSSFASDRWRWMTALFALAYWAAAAARGTGEHHHRNADRMTVGLEFAADIFAAHVGEKFSDDDCLR
jgi:hypothetical protein